MDRETKRLHQAIGRRIRSLRNEAGWTQEELAARTGLHRTYIGKLERGESGVTIDSVAILCRSLGVTLAEFFEPFTGTYDLSGPRRER